MYRYTSTKGGTLQRNFLSQKLILPGLRLNIVENSDFFFLDLPCLLHMEQNTLIARVPIFISWKGMECLLFP